MINAIILLVFAISTSSYAGSANCTGVTAITASGLTYNASSSDCVISVEKTVYEDTLIVLPAGQLGDEFTVQDNTSYSLDHCDEPYWDEETQQNITFCYPYGVSISAVNALVDEAGTLTLSGYYVQGSPQRQRVKLTFDGSNWQAQYSYF